MTTLVTVVVVIAVSVFILSLRDMRDTVRRGR
jgi:hypothetical protein